MRFFKPKYTQSVFYAIALTKSDLICQHTDLKFARFIKLNGLVDIVNAHKVQFVHWHSPNQTRYTSTGCVKTTTFTELNGLKGNLSALKKSAINPK